MCTWNVAQSTCNSTDFYTQFENIYNWVEVVLICVLYSVCLLALELFQDALQTLSVIVKLYILENLVTTL